MAEDTNAIDWRELSDEDREREYSPSSCIDDITPFLEDYRALSDAARQECEATGHSVVELSYGDAASQSVDLVVPSAAAATPLLVYIHGGYWQQLSKLDAFFSAAQCLHHNIAFATVDYTLAPAATLDEIVSECHAALRALRDSAAGHNIDPDHIIVCGSSAGGHLSAMVGLGAPDGWRPAAVGLISGVFELEPLIGTSINDAVGLDVAAAHRNSPMLADLANFPPAVIAYGDNEPNQFKWQSDEFARRVSRAGSQVSTTEIAERNHFDVVVELCDFETILGRQILDLVRTVAPEGG